MIKLIIPGDPRTKKNSARIIINKKTGRPMTLPSKAYEDYEKMALWALKKYKGHPMAEKVNVMCYYYMATRRRVDLNNLLEATTDILVKGGVLIDDNCKVIAGHDGSRVFYDKQEPRVEIYVEPMSCIEPLPPERDPLLNWPREARCNGCGGLITDKYSYCPFCGREIVWDEWEEDDEC